MIKFRGVHSIRDIQLEELIESVDNKLEKIPYRNTTLDSIRNSISSMTPILSTIEETQEHIKYLIDNPDVRKRILDIKDFEPAKNVPVEIPSNISDTYEDIENSFKHAFKRLNDYKLTVEHLAQQTDTDNMPPRLKEMFDLAKSDSKSEDLVNIIGKENSIQTTNLYAEINSNNKLKKSPYIISSVASAGTYSIFLTDPGAAIAAGAVGALFAGLSFADGFKKYKFKNIKKSNIYVYDGKNKRAISTVNDEELANIIKNLELERSIKDGQSFAVEVDYDYKKNILSAGYTYGNLNNETKLIKKNDIDFEFKEQDIEKIKLEETENIYFEKLRMYSILEKTGLLHAKEAGQITLYGKEVNTAVEWSDLFEQKMQDSIVLATAAEWAEAYHDKGIPTTFGVESNKTKLIKHINPILGLQRIIPVLNNYDSSDAQVQVVKGPVGNGKSSHLLGIGLHEAMYSAGLFNVAKRAEIEEKDNVLVTTSIPGDLKEGKSRMMLDYENAEKVLDHATSKSRIILDDTYIGAETEKAGEKLCELIEGLSVTGAQILVATHNKVVADFAELQPYAKNFHVKIDEYGDQTYMVKPGASNSCNLDIMSEKAGVDKNSIKDKLKYKLDNGLIENTDRLKQYLES